MLTPLQRFLSGVGRQGCVPSPSTAPAFAAMLKLLLWDAQVCVCCPWLSLPLGLFPASPWLAVVNVTLNSGCVLTARTCPPGVGLQKQRVQSVLMQHITAPAQGPLAHARGLLLGGKMSLDER